MKIFKENGITLVALVVTIIILLILAGVTLNIALSENGLFKRAKNATERYQIAGREENNQLTELEKQLNKYGQGVIESSEVEKYLTQYQGKYVDIGLDANENTDTTDDWEIFYAGNGRIFLIAADYVPVTKLTSWSIIGDSGTLKNNGFQRYSSDYKYSVNWSTPTGFLDLPDLNLVMHIGYSLADNNTKTNSIAVSHLLNKDKWKGIKDAAEKSDYIDFVIGGPTLEMWCAAWKEAVKGDANGFVALEDDPQTSGTGYNVKYNETSIDWLYVTGDQSTEPNASKLAEYNTFFPHTFYYEGCNGYWLASPSTGDSNHLMVMVSSGSMGHCGYDRWVYSVRPVVSLISGVKLVEKEGTENYYGITK